MELEDLLRLPSDDLRRQAKMGFEVFPNLDALFEYFARSMADEIRTNNQQGRPTRWILPVGPVRQYFLLTEICNREGITWENVHTFQMDEFLDWQARPLPLSHALSFEGFMRREVFARLEPRLRPLPDHVHFPSPFAPDQISEQIEAAGGVDTCFGGIGFHGHVAFNEPPISRWYKISVEQLRQSLTRVVALGDDSLVVQSIHCSGGSTGMIPPMAVTLGMRDILAARRIRLYLAGGERHRAVFRIALAGDVAVDYPCTLLQGHPDCVIFTDQATARPVVPTLF